MSEQRSSGLDILWHKLTMIRTPQNDIMSVPRHLKQ